MQIFHESEFEEFLGLFTHHLEGLLLETLGGRPLSQVAGDLARIYGLKSRVTVNDRMARGMSISVNWTTKEGLNLETAAYWYLYPARHRISRYHENAPELEREWVRLARSWVKDISEPGIYYLFFPSGRDYPVLEKSFFQRRSIGLVDWKASRKIRRIIELLSEGLEAHAEGVYKLGPALSFYMQAWIWFQFLQALVRRRNQIYLFFQEFTLEEEFDRLIRALEDYSEGQFYTDDGFSVVRARRFSNITFPKEVYSLDWPWGVQIVVSPARGRRQKTSDILLEEDPYDWIFEISTIALKLDSNR